MRQTKDETFRPITPYRTQFNTMIGITLAISVGCIIGIISGILEGFGPQLMAAFFAAIALLIWLIAWSYRAKIAGLSAEGSYAHWHYDDTTWSAYRENFAIRNARLPIKLAALFGCSGLLVAILVQNDGELIWNSVATTYVAFIGAGAAFGCVLGIAIRWLDNGPLHIMERHRGECLIGPAGLYITGQFWPWKTTGQGLVAATLGDTGSGELRFDFQTGTARKTVSVPVPRGQEAIARDVIERLRPS